MYDKNKHSLLSKEKKAEHDYSKIVHVSSVNKLKGCNGKTMTGYNMTAGRGFRNK